MKQDEIKEYIKNQRDKGLDAIGCWQLQIAANMGISEEKLDLLSSTALSFANREWVYIALIEQVPVEDLTSLPEITANTILEARQNYLQNTFGKPKELQEQIVSLGESVKLQLEESKTLRTFLEKQRKKEESDVIRVKELLENKEETLREVYNSKAEIEKRCKMLEEQLLEFKGGETEEAVSEGEGHREENIKTEKYEKKYSLLQWMDKRKLQKQQKIFVELLQKNDFDMKQKEFLISCMEAGDPVQIIKNIAYPRFSVDTMRQIRQLMLRER